MGSYLKYSQFASAFYLKTEHGPGIIALACVKHANTPIHPRFIRGLFSSLINLTSHANFPRVNYQSKLMQNSREIFFLQGKRDDRVHVINCLCGRKYDPLLT